jgi:hypothetical protein
MSKPNDPLGGRLEPRVGPWQLPLPAGAKDCHDWEKMQSSAAQRPAVQLRPSLRVQVVTRTASHNEKWYLIATPEGVSWNRMLGSPRPRTRLSRDRENHPAGAPGRVTCAAPRVAPRRDPSSRSPRHFALPVLACPQRRR